jgi:hypothetical protein
MLLQQDVPPLLIERRRDVSWVSRPVISIFVRLKFSAGWDWMQTVVPDFTVLG